MNFYKKNRIIASLVSFLIVLSVIICSFLFIGRAGKVKEYVTIEAGAAVPAAEAFFLSDKTTGNFITDIYAIDTGKIGVIEIELEIKGKKHVSALIIEDTIPPAGSPLELYIFENSGINPGDFVSDITDATQVTCAFAPGFVPDLSKTGWQDITVILTDEGGNTTNINSRFYVFDVAENLVIEVGTADNISINAIVLNHTDGGGLSFALDSDEKIDFSSPGVYYMTVASGGYAMQTTVEIRDTIPPAGDPVILYVFPDSEINPGDLVANVIDATNVAYSFDPGFTPDLNKAGWQDITVILTDEGQNITEIATKIYVFDVAGMIEIEAGTKSRVWVQDFVKNNLSNNDGALISITHDDPIDFSVPEYYRVTLECGGYKTLAVVKIQDTTPPKASIRRNIWTFKDSPLPAGDFVYDIIDVSPVTVRYKSLPDFSVQGIQTVYIILEDAYGNSSEYTARLNVVVDTAPPVISGELNKRVVLGGTVSYRSGITVTDDYDINVQLAVDSSAVNLNKAGVYTVIYSATDSSGNRTEERGTVTVYEINLAYVNGIADDILSRIINDGMSQREKAKAIFDWLSNKMKYTVTNTPQDLAQRAHDGLTKGTGNCYSYAATSQVLLTRAGIKNMMINRIPEASVAHYWNLVDTGGGWHHFDVCPVPGGTVSPAQRFMFTDRQAREFTGRIRTSYPYFQYDQSKFPDVVE